MSYRIGDVFLTKSLRFVLRFRPRRFRKQLPYFFFPAWQRSSVLRLFLLPAFKAEIASDTANRRCDGSNNTGKLHPFHSAEDDRGQNAADSKRERREADFSLDTQLAIPFLYNLPSGKERRLTAQTAPS